MRDDKTTFFFIATFGVVLLLFILGYLIKHQEDKEVYEETITETECTVDYEKQIEELNNKISSLQDQNDVLSFEIEELYSVIERERYAKTELKHIYNLTNEEKELLSRLVKCEAGAEPFECKVVVCVVVFNRMFDTRFKNTLSEVIYEEGQFSPAIEGTIDTAVPTPDCYFAVESALSLTYKEMNDDYGTDLLFFRAATEEKTWGKNNNYAFTIGKTDFYRLK